MFKLYSVFTGELFDGAIDFVDTCDLAIAMEKEKGGGFKVFQEMWDTSLINEELEQTLVQAAA